MSVDQLPRVRVVVLNWNSAWYTRRCLRALELTDYPADRFEVVLVDNGSVDGSLEQLRASFPDLRIIANGANLGFAEGCNRGMRDRGDVDHVALVNNDAVVESGWLRPLVDALEADPTVGAASVRLVLEPGFVPVDVTADETVFVLGASVDGADASGGIRFNGWRAVSALDWPLDLTHELSAGAGRLWIPAGPEATRVDLRLGGRGGFTLRSGAVTASGRAPTSVTFAPAPDRTRLLNGIGTSLNERCEGFDLHYGEVDRGDLALTEVAGFCGGGALLRGRMLDQVGLFDPRLFAYYEDTDLSWRARRAGWRIVGVPGSVIHHAFGGSAGSRATGFFYLDRRNWLLTADRNGSPEERKAVRSAARGSVIGAARANLFGRARRLQRPRAVLVGSWARVLADVVLEGRRRRHPSAAPIGAAATDAVLGRFQPRPGPRSPSPRPGGPLLVYVDVTRILAAGAHRRHEVARRLVVDLPDAAPGIEVVPIVSVVGRSAYRRTTPAEYSRLLDPDWSGREEGVDVLPVDALVPGSVLLDLEAGYRIDEELVRRLPAMVERGVRIVPYIQPPGTAEAAASEPSWSPDPAEPTLRALIRSASVVVTASDVTVGPLQALARQLDRSDLSIEQVRPTDHADCPALAGAVAAAVLDGLRTGDSAEDSWRTGGH